MRVILDTGYTQTAYDLGQEGRVPMVEDREIYKSEPQLTATDRFRVSVSQMAQPGAAQVTASSVIRKPALQSG